MRVEGRQGEGEGRGPGRARWGRGCFKLSPVLSNVFVAVTLAVTLHPTIHTSHAVICHSHMHGMCERRARRSRSFCKLLLARECVALPALCAHQLPHFWILCDVLQTYARHARAAGKAEQRVRQAEAKAAKEEAKRQEDLRTYKHLMKVWGCGEEVWVGVRHGALCCEDS